MDVEIFIKFCFIIELIWNARKYSFCYLNFKIILINNLSLRNLFIQISHIIFLMLILLYHIFLRIEVLLLLILCLYSRNIKFTESFL
ncbi:hypothetical protein BCR36DRAFT_442489 [Piromyces finnis]|uniref:Uncharacterized protein n=1 Tax=Piromyces finnis TaxID=1754191 RepID=A0A1Y1VF71_9FUNG|nr:hypothetical protein BCR36DRAFT_442489 [Piromyces finnis]|eukprot:ORX53893.1 hypothetical protein BCR36DRAFT_442489 [Piromyces finnis]